MLDKQTLQQLTSLKQQIHDSQERHTATVKGTPWKHGFAVLADGRQLQIPFEEMNKVFPGDSIAILVTKDEKGKDVATVEKLHNSELKTFYGQVRMRNNNAFVLPDLPYLNRWLFIPPKQLKGAKNGDYVQAEISRHPIKTGKPQVKIVQIIGGKNETAIERNYIIQKFGLCSRWPEGLSESLTENAKKILEQEIAARSDFTHLPFITIDNEKTLDIDDALCVEPTDSGWTLTIAIADPAAFIQPDSELEQHIRDRATSIYLPGRTLPMLPEVLCNDYCSLLPGQKRLAMLCQMNVASDGLISEVSFCEGVIESKQKLSYEQAAILLAQQDANSESADTDKLCVQNQLKRLWQVRQALFSYRQKNALVMPEKPDYRFDLNERQHIVDIHLIERNDAHRLVEECMLACNRTAANFLKTNTDSALYVTHPGFRAEKLPSVKKLLTTVFPDQDFGDLTQLDNYRQLIQTIELQSSELQSSELQSAELQSTELQSAKQQTQEQQTPEQTVYALLSKMLERSVADTTPKPHMGLGFDCYTTFTSPLRKYHDLLVHRIFKAIIKSQPVISISSNQIEFMQNKTQQARQSCNQLEQWLKCLFITQHRGYEFEATIQHIHSRGLHCRIEVWDISATIDTKSFKEKLKFDPVMMVMKLSQQRFRLGQKINIKITGIDEVRRQISAEWVKPKTDSA